MKTYYSFPSMDRLIHEWAKCMYGDSSDPYTQKDVEKSECYQERDTRFDIQFFMPKGKPQDVVETWNLPQDEIIPRLSSKAMLYGNDEEESDLHFVEDTPTDKSEEYSDEHIETREDPRNR